MSAAIAQHYPRSRQEPMALSRTASAASTLSRASSIASAIGGSYIDRASPIPFDEKGNSYSDLEDPSGTVPNGDNAWKNYSKQFGSREQVDEAVTNEGHQRGTQKSTSREREPSQELHQRRSQQPQRRAVPAPERTVSRSLMDDDYSDVTPRTGTDNAEDGIQDGVGLPPPASGGKFNPNWEFDSVYYEDNYANFNVPYDRQYEESYRRQLLSKARQKEEVHLRQTLEMEECTFHPTINPERGRKKVAQEVFERLANSRSAFHRRQEQIKLEQEEEELEECYFAPEINRNYEAKLQEWIGDSTATERLYGHAVHKQHQRELLQEKAREEEATMLQQKELSVARSRSKDGFVPRVAKSYLEEQRSRNERANKLKQKIIQEENVTFKPSINKKPPSMKNERAMHKIEVTLTDADRLRREKNMQRLQRIREAEHGIPEAIFQQAHREFNDLILQGSERHSEMVTGNNSNNDDEESSQVDLDDTQPFKRDGPGGSSSTSSFLARQQRDIENRWERTLSGGGHTSRSHSAQAHHRSVSANTSGATNTSQAFAKLDATVDRRAEKKRKPLHLPLKCQDQQFLDAAHKMNTSQQRAELRNTLHQNRQRFESLKKRNVYRETSRARPSSATAPAAVSTGTTKMNPKQQSEDESEGMLTSGDNLTTTTDDEENKDKRTPRQKKIRVSTYNNSTAASRSAVRATKLLQQQGVEFGVVFNDPNSSKMTGQDPASCEKQRTESMSPKKNYKKIPFVNATGKEVLVTATQPFENIKAHAQKSAAHKEKVAREIVEERIQKKLQKEEEEMEGATFNPETNGGAIFTPCDIREVKSKVLVSGESHFLKRMELAKQRKLEAAAKLKVKPAAVKRRPYVNQQGQRSMVTNVQPFENLEQHLVESEMHRHRVEAEIECEHRDTCQFQPTTNTQRYYNSGMVHSVGTSFIGADGGRTDCYGRPQSGVTTCDASRVDYDEDEVQHHIPSADDSGVTAAAVKQFADEAAAATAEQHEPHHHEETIQTTSTFTQDSGVQERENDRGLHRDDHQHDLSVQQQQHHVDPSFHDVSRSTTLGDEAHNFSGTEWRFEHQSHNANSQSTSQKPSAARSARVYPAPVMTPVRGKSSASQRSSLMAPSSAASSPSPKATGAPLSHIEDLPKKAGTYKQLVSPAMESPPSPRRRTRVPAGQSANDTQVAPNVVDHRPPSPPEEKNEAGPTSMEERSPEQATQLQQLAAGLSVEPHEEHDIVAQYTNEQLSLHQQQHQENLLPPTPPQPQPTRQQQALGMMLDEMFAPSTTSPSDVVQQSEQPFHVIHEVDTPVPSSSVPEQQLEQACEDEEKETEREDIVPTDHNNVERQHSTPRKDATIDLDSLFQGALGSSRGAAVPAMEEATPEPRNPLQPQPYDEVDLSAVSDQRDGTIDPVSYRGRSTTYDELDEEQDINKKEEDVVQSDEEDSAHASGKKESLMVENETFGESVHSVHSQRSLNDETLTSNTNTNNNNDVVDVEEDHEHSHDDDETADSSSHLNSYARHVVVDYDDSDGIENEDGH